MFEKKLPRNWFKGMHWRDAWDARFRIYENNNYILMQVAQRIYGLLLMKSTMTMSEFCTVVGSGAKNADTLQRVAIMYLYDHDYIVASDTNLSFSLNPDTLWLLPKLSVKARAG